MFELIGWVRKYPNYTVEIFYNERTEDYVATVILRGEFGEELDRRGEHIDPKHIRTVILTVLDRLRLYTLPKAHAKHKQAETARKSQNV